MPEMLSHFLLTWLLILTVFRVHQVVVDASQGFVDKQDEGGAGRTAAHSPTAPHVGVRKETRFSLLNFKSKL